MRNNTLKSVLILLILAISSLVNAQMADDISFYVDETELTIIRGREEILETLRAGDIKRSKEIYKNLQKTARSQNQEAFTYTDVLYISMLTRSWSEWINYAANIEEKIALPVFDNIRFLTDILDSLVYEGAEGIMRDIERSAIGEEDKDLLQMFTYIISYRSIDKEYRKRMNNFEADYPRTKYYTFVAGFLPLVPRKESINIGAGTRKFITQDGLSDYFKPSSLFDLSVGFNVGRLYSALYLNTGSVEIEQKISVPSGNQTITLEAQSLFSTFAAGAQVGVFALRDEYFQLAPYANIGVFSSTPKKVGNQEYDKIINSLSYGLGLNVQYKLIEGNTSPYYRYGFESNPYPTKQYLAIKLQLGYDFLDEDRFSKADMYGNFMSAQLGLVWGFGEF